MTDTQGDPNMTDSTSGSSGAKPGRPGGVNLVHLILEGRAFFALIAIIAVFSVLSPNYFSLSNFLIMSSQVAIFGLLAIGMLLVILSGGIDLSVGSTLALSGVFAGFLMQGVELAALGVILYLPVWAVVICTLAVGAFVGLVNGILVAWFKVPAFVATLGTLYVARGVALLMTNGLTFNDLAGSPELGNTGFEWLGFNRLWGRALQHLRPDRGRDRHLSAVDPYTLWPLALLYRRQSEGSRAVRRSREFSLHLGLCALGHLRGGRRHCAEFAADLGRPHGWDHL